MKILNIIQRYPPAIGGSELWCRDFSRFLAGRGIISRVATINLYDIAEAFDKNFKEEGVIRLGREDFDEGVFVKRYRLWKSWETALSVKIIKFILYKLKFSKTQIGDIFVTSPHSLEMYRNLFKEIRDSDVVAIHTLPYFHTIVGYLIAKLYKKNILVIPHFHPGHIQYERKIFYSMMNNCDVVIADSEYEKKYLADKGVVPKKIIVFGNAISLGQKQRKDDFEVFKKMVFEKYEMNEKYKKIIFIGRKEAYKGIFVLIDALNRLLEEEEIPLCLFLIGPDTLDFKQRYPSFYKSEALKIINFGVVSEEAMENLLIMSDVLVLPSEFEAFGRVFLEAWKYEKPVIGGNRGAVPAVIADAGLCVEPNNAVDLKNKIKKIILDEALAREMGAKGRRKIMNQYSIERVYGKSINILNDLFAKKRKLLIVSQLFPPYYIGGSEIVAFEQSKMLKKMNWQVRIFAGKINDSLRRFKISQEKKEFDITRINLHQRDFSHSQYVGFDKEELRIIFREELYRYAPDIVHFHNIYAFSLGMIEDCFKMNIPIVITLHDYWGICPKILLLAEKGRTCTRNDGDCAGCHGQMVLESGVTLSPYERNSKCLEYYRKINLFISPSRYLAERFIERGLAREKFEIIKYGINLSRFKRENKIKFKKIRFGFFGQVAWHKGVDMLLQAILSLKKNEKDKISVFIVGTGDKPYLTYCKEMSKDLKCVTFCGKIHHRKIHKFYGKIDVLILPSRWPENSPLVIQEAMVCGIPVIATDNGGIPELIEDGVTGYLFRENNPNSLVKILKEIIAAPEKIARMSSSCILKTKEFELMTQVKNISRCYEDILNGDKYFHNKELQNRAATVLKTPEENKVRSLFS